MLFPMSPCRRTVGHKSEPDATSALKLTQERLEAGADSSPRPDPRRHSSVCCCLLCEQVGTGEQAVRSVAGDYERFLASVTSPAPRSGSPTAPSPKPSRKPSRYGAFPMRRREPARVLGPYPQDQQWRIIQIDAKGRIAVLARLYTSLPYPGRRSDRGAESARRRGELSPRE